MISPPSLGEEEARILILSTSSPRASTRYLFSMTCKAGDAEDGAELVEQTAWHRLVTVPRASSRGGSSAHTL